MSTLDQTPGGMAPQEGTLGGEEPPAPVPAAPRTPPGPPLDRVEPLNLSHRPFLNSRPVVRVSLLLLLLGLGLLMWNVVQFQRYLSESADKRAQIEKGVREIASQQKVNDDLQGRLAALPLGQMNQRVEFLNEMIAERTFSWSLLLDRLTDTLPKDVRLVRLTPRLSRDEQQRQRNRRRTEDEVRRVPLEISAESRGDDNAHLQLVDNLFAHPAFDDADLTRQEQVEETNLLRFEVTVQYIPGGAPQDIEEVPTVEELSAPTPTPGPPTTSPGNSGGGRP